MEVIVLQTCVWKVQFCRFVYGRYCSVDLHVRFSSLNLYRVLHNSIECLVLQVLGKIQFCRLVQFCKLVQKVYLYRLVCLKSIVLQISVVQFCRFVWEVQFCKLVQKVQFHRLNIACKVTETCSDDIFIICLLHAYYVITFVIIFRGECHNLSGTVSHVKAPMKLNVANLLSDTFNCLWKERLPVRRDTLEHMY